jgi:DNA-directed RNA polymerase specialized sigma24 family protein
MSFEPLKSKLIDRRGRQVAEPVQATVIRAFERAVTIPDANIDKLVLGAARVARVIADGEAKKPEEYAATVLRRIAWQSQRDFMDHPQTDSLSEKETESIEARRGSSATILAGIEIQQLLSNLNDRDRKIVTMRSRGFRYEDIALQVGMLEVSVRCRYHLAKNRLRKLAGGE